MNTVSQTLVRDAQETDIPALTAIKGAGSEAVHCDRLRDALSPETRYLVLQAGEEVVAFASLVFHRPAYWSDAADTQHLPQIVDLQVAEAHRGQGYGTQLVHALEQFAAQAGYGHIYLNVEPVDNPRAYALYQRLGYQSIQPEPYLCVWEFTDSAGKLHHGENWVVDMVKEIK